MQDHFFEPGALGIALLASAASLVATANSGEHHAATRTVHVTGSGIDELSGAIVHSKQSTSTGVIQRSTETVELTGDLRGRVLYHVTSVFDFKAGTLVNTGDQVFSGTVAGSEPVLLHDSKFRFDGDLNSGEDTGSVYLLDHIAGPRVECILKVIGTGKNQHGNPTFTYSGQCRFPDA
jgi:hypothetical protein